MPKPTYEELLAFVQTVGGLLIDGDIHPDTGEEVMADGNDDEIDALYSFVSQARDLLGTDGSGLPITTAKADAA